MRFRIVRRIAVGVRGPVGRAATAWLCRRATDPRASRPPDVQTLLDVLGDGPDRRARDLASAALARLWTAGGQHRIAIWRGALRRRSDGLAPPALLRFLLDADPQSPYVPRIRLTTGLSLEDDPRHGVDLGTARRLVEMAGAADPAIARVLSSTGQPRLLEELERAFAADVSGVFLADRRPPLWTGAGEPGPVMAAVLANPHLPRPVTPRTDIHLAGLLALRNRVELVDGFDAPGRAAAELCRVVAVSPVTRLVTACELALRALPPGPARRTVCSLALGGTYDRAVAAAAAAAAVDAGYLDDPSLGPLVLLVSGNWDRLTALDPDGEAFRRYRVRFPATAGWDALGHVLWTLERGDVPPAVRRVCLETLADLHHPDDRDQLCRFAMYRGPTTIRTVAAEAGYLPSDDDEVVPFLYLTGQWDRYVAADPDGRRMRAYADALAPEDTARDAIRAAAAGAGRHPPCAATRPVGRRSRTGGYGVTGSGAYIDGGYGCGGSVHT